MLIRNIYVNKYVYIYILCVVVVSATHIHCSLPQTDNTLLPYGYKNSQMEFIKLA